MKASTMARIGFISPFLRQYGIPLATVATGLMLAAFIRTFLPDIIFLPLLVAVAISAWYGEQVGGWVALTIAALGSVYFQLSPIYSFAIADLHDAIRLGIFVLAASTMIWFFHSRQQLMDRLTALLHETGERERLLRQKQEEVIHAGKLATIGQLAAGITHELNNPLNNVNLYLGLLRDLSRTNELSQERVAHIAEEAQGQIKRAAEIVSHLRLFARGGEAVRQPCALHDIIHRSLSFVQEPLRLAGVTASFTRSAAEILVHGNQTQLEQVFVNLLLNAKDAMSQTTTKRVMITIKKDSALATILVDDTGPGIPSEIVPTLFTPFITTKPLGAGLGLGLSICYSIVKTHHGHISAERSPFGGARFILTFPVSEPTPHLESAQSTL